MNLPAVISSHDSLSSGMISAILVSYRRLSLVRAVRYPL
jgi:hypothetical protein